MEDPFILYVSKRFLDKATKTFELGLFTRKPLLEIAKRIGLVFVEIDREGAKRSIERLGESKGLRISGSDVLKNLTMAFFLPTGIFYSMMKKVHYRSGIESDDFIFIEFLAEIPRAFKTALFYDVWLVIPKSDTGGKKAVEFIRKIVKEVNEIPLNEEEWQKLRPIREKLEGKIDVKGTAENLWTQII